MIIGLIICGMIGLPEAILIIVALLVLFGGKKIPELMKGLGEGLKEFKKASQDIKKEDEEKKEKQQ